MSTAGAESKRSGVYSVNTHFYFNYTRRSRVVESIVSEDLGE